MKLTTLKNYKVLVVTRVTNKTGTIGVDAEVGAATVIGTVVVIK
jgi:hypothetical protein